MREREHGTPDRQAPDHARPVRPVHPVTALQRGAGNAAVGRMLQRAWKFGPDFGRLDRSQDVYWWDGVGGAEPSLAPGIARRLNLRRVNAPVGDVAFTEAQYLEFAKGASRKQASSYNPFGRFSENVTTTAFLAFPGVSVPQELGDAGEHEPIDVDATQRMQGFREIDPGIPAEVMTTQGKRLNAIGVVPPWGVLYGDAPPMPSSMYPNRSVRLAKPVGVPAKVKLALDTLGTLQTAVRIDQSTLSGYKGTRKDDIAQLTIMGVSAGEVAHAAGYDAAVDPDFAADPKSRKRGWEWLHLVAYELGGPSGSGPQTAANLVVGTTAANTAMIMVEDAIVDAVASGAAKSADVQVAALLDDDEYRVASEIHYHIQFTLPDDRVVPMPVLTFSALAVSTPFVASNRYFRQMLRQHLRDQAAEAQEPSMMQMV